MLCIETNALTDPGGATGVRLPPPMGSNSFVFTFIFAKKHPNRRSVPPPTTGNPGSATGMSPNPIGKFCLWAVNNRGYCICSNLPIATVLILVIWKKMSNIFRISMTNHFTGIKGIVVSFQGPLWEFPLKLSRQNPLEVVWMKEYDVSCSHPSHRTYFQNISKVNILSLNSV